MSYTLIKNFAPIVSNGARSGIKMSKVIGVTIHMTDNWGKGAGAKAHANYLKNVGKNTQASWHYCVDDTYVSQSIPEDEVSWNAGDSRGDGNMKTISVEICVNPDSDLTQACNNAVLLAADILKRHKLNSNCLYRHYDWSGKDCPSMIIDGKPFNWSTFKSKVTAALKVENKVEVEEDTDIKDTSAGIIGVGATVIFDGKSNCYETASGIGKGIVPPAGKYKVTHYKPGAVCSIHISNYGWVPAKNCNLDKLSEVSESKIKKGSTVVFDGKSNCYATSSGQGKGMIPVAGKYVVTYYQEGTKCPIHIGSFGWVPAENCTLNGENLSKIEAGSTVLFDGKDNCYLSSVGDKKGVVPPSGIYRVTHYNAGAKYPIHIGTYGWVAAKNCTLK